jgi:purine-cytosine permease-like protein
MGRFSIPVPGSRLWRVALGVALVIGGFLGFLPILGFWMIPLGLLVLSIDLAIVRRRRRKAEVWWGRRNKPKNNPQT